MFHILRAGGAESTESRSSQSRQPFPILTLLFRPSSSSSYTTTTTAATNTQTINNYMRFLLLLLLLLLLPTKRNMSYSLGPSCPSLHYSAALLSCHQSFSRQIFHLRVHVHIHKYTCISMNNNQCALKRHEWVVGRLRHAHNISLWPKCRYAPAVIKTPAKGARKSQQYSPF